MNCPKQNKERLTRRGLDAEFVTNYEQVYDETQILDNDQEKLKAELKTKTKTLEQKTGDMDALYAEAKKTVKIEFDSSAWKEFGINDKR